MISRNNKSFGIKLLFTRHPKLLKNLVANLLGISVKNISGFEMRNPEIPPESLGKKFCRLDIAMTVDGRRVTLEIQVGHEDDYANRALFYWALDFSSALSEGMPYRMLPSTIVISIVDFKLFNDSPEFHSEFRDLEVTRHTPLTGKMGVHFYELPKLPESVSTKNKLELWLSLFKAKTEEDLARIKGLEVPVMNQAIEAYHSVAVSREFKELERLRSKARHDEAQALGTAREQGIHEGIQKGKQEGKLEEKIDVAKAALSMAMPIDNIVKLTGLSRKEIEALQSH